VDAWITWDPYVASVDHDAATIERANARRSYAVRPVLAQNFGEQQKIADTFFEAGLLPASVDTAQAQRWDFGGETRGDRG
jgi:sulfonate transport system substrate-binding protein